ncbi:MAG: ATP-binding cassette domain-containing protein [Methylotetracoccus sp.]
MSDLKLQIPPGQFVAVVGRSGCGKSTLLRLIARLEQAAAGRVDNGRSGDGGTATCCVMFQDARLLPWRRVLANVRLGLPESWTERAADALRQVGLSSYAAEWPAVLSGGQRQRVALARALIRHPDLLLLDEPLGALDALTRIEMQGLIERLWREQGFTALLVTHDVAEAVTLADRIVMLEGGRILHDIAVTLPRPRDRSNPSFAALEGMVLSWLLGPATV